MIARFILLLLFCPLLVCGQESRRGVFSVEIDIKAQAKRWPERNFWSASVMSREGVKHYEIWKEVYFDVQYPAIHIADDSRAVVASPFDGWVEFYDNRGYLVTQIRPFGDSPVDYERIIKCSVSGGRAAFLVSEPEGAAARVFVTDLEGRELWSALLPHPQAGEVFISDDGEHLLAGSYDTREGAAWATTVFTGSGQAVKSIDMLFRYADIATGNGAVVLSDRNSVILTSLAGDETGVWRTSRREDIISSVRFAASRVAVVVETIDASEDGIAYVNPTIVLLDDAARVVAQSHLDTRSALPAKLVVSGDERVSIAAEGKVASLPVR
jgi:hypothetical protein